MSEKVVALSRCPHCGARGLMKDEPLVMDGMNTDVPYCGRCGRNWPHDAPRASPATITRIEEGR